MNSKKMIKIAILAVALIVLLNPGFLPFSEGTLGAVKAQLSTHISEVLGGNTGIFSVATLIPALAVIVICWLVASVVEMILSCITAKKARTRTVIGLTASIVKYASVLIGVIWTLSVMGVNLGAIFASLGVLTLIIGFGAQSLIEDMVTGIFIIFEGNYNVDDVIVLDDFRGTVRKIGIRTTTIEDAGGNFKVVNNSDIRNIQNRSNNLSLAICDIDISYDEDIRKVEKLVAPKLHQIYEKNSNIFRSVPIYKGVQELGDSGVTLRYTVECNESDFFPARRLLNREMKILFDDLKIDVPFPQLDVNIRK